MKLDYLVKIMGSEPVFSSAMLTAEGCTPAAIQMQLSRWVKAGKLIQLRRGLYTLSSIHRKIPAHPFVIANNIKKASYVSLQSALAYYGLIPEYTPVTTSVTTSRPGKYDTPLGSFSYTVIKKSLFNGYSHIQLSDKQSAFIASPEKSLLDLVYLTPRSDSWEFLKELRLQNTERLNIATLSDLARQSGSPKIKRATDKVIHLIEEESEAYIEL